MTCRAVLLSFVIAACSCTNPTQLDANNILGGHGDGDEPGDLGERYEPDAELDGAIATTDLAATLSTSDLAPQTQTSDLASAEPSSDLASTSDLATSPATEDLQTPDLVVAPDMAAMPKRVFVTKDSFQGDAVLDACQAAADDAGLGGTWVPWLSTSLLSAKARIPGNGPWQALTGETVFSDAAQLATKPTVPIRTDETGAAVDEGLYVWTGTDNGGSATVYTCWSWSSTGATFGTVGRTGIVEEWTFAYYLKCRSTARLYCFEQ